MKAQFRSQLAEQQNLELEALVHDPKKLEIIRMVMAATLLAFMALTKNEMRLTIKFLIESIDDIEEERTPNE